MPRTAFLAIGLIIAATTAQATQQGIVMLSKWKAADLCAKKAQQAFPDFTPEANAKRDAQLKLCLEQQALPPRAPQ
jgi:hypothetical protein